MAKYILILLSFIFSVALTNKVDRVKSLESDLERELNTHLESILRKEDFNLMISVFSRVERTKIPVSVGSKEQKSELKEIEEPPALPGFQNKPTLPEADAKKNIDSEETFKFEDKLIISAAKLRLFLRQNISQEMETMAKELITERVQSRIDQIPEIVVSRVEHLYPNQEKTVQTSNLFIDFIEENFSSLVLGLGLFLAMLAVVFIVGNMLKDLARIGKKLKTDHTDHSENDNKDSSEDQSYAVPGYVAVILEFMSEFPLLGNEFLKGLNKEQACALYKSISTEKNRSMIARNLKFEEEDLMKSEDSSDMTEENAHRTLRDLATEVEHFKKIYKAQSGQRFGFLGLLAGEAIFRLIPAENKGLFLAVLGDYVSNVQMQQMLKQATSDDKAKMMACLYENAVSESQLDDCEKVLKEKYDLEKSSLHNKDLSLPENRIRSLLDNDLEAKNTVLKLNELGVQLAELDAYKIGCKELFMEKEEQVGSLLEDLENSQIVSLIQSYPEFEGTIVDRLTNVRRSLINSLLNTYKASGKEKAEAQITLLKKFRNKAVKGYKP